MYFLGVDGGGTKTQVVIVDESGNIVSSFTTGPSLLYSYSSSEILKTLEEGIREVVRSFGSKKVEIVKSCFGMAGVDTPQGYALLSGIIKKIKVDLGDNPIILNDTVCALRRGTDKGFGIAIVGGTGSNCYGKSRFGKEAFIGGLGHILSDEGGSYYIGDKVLHAAAKSFDGRTGKTLLEGMVYEHFGVLSMRDVYDTVMKEGFGKKDIAQLSVVSEEASEKGDHIAREILIDAGKELVSMVETCAQQLSMYEDSFDLVCIGGSFKRPKGPIRTYFENQIKTDLKKVNIVYPTNEPAIGAAMIAIEKFKGKS